mgnify:CR=1 FL=1
MSEIGDRRAVEVLKSWTYFEDLRRQSQTRAARLALVLLPILDSRHPERLQGIPGYGPVLASAFHGTVGNGTAYRRGRDVAASLGLVPRQHSSGGKARLLGISKRGDRYLRSLLVHGARAVVSRAGGKTDPLSLWINRLRERRGFNRAVVALANKLARIGWAVLAHNTTYQAQRAA